MPELSCTKSPFHAQDQLFTDTERACGREEWRFLEFRQPSMPAKLFVSVQFTTKTEPTPNDLLVLDNTRYQRNAVVLALAAQLGSSLSQRIPFPFK
ncbi:MAG: hypothetical protein ACLQU5_24990 [Isosphaeraceae bacterium]